MILRPTETGPLDRHVLKASWMLQAVTCHSTRSTFAWATPCTFKLYKVNYVHTGGMSMTHCFIHYLGDSHHPCWLEGIKIALDFYVVQWTLSGITVRVLSHLEQVPTQGSLVTRFQEKLYCWITVILITNAACWLLLEGLSLVIGLMKHQNLIKYSNKGHMFTKKRTVYCIIYETPDSESDLWFVKTLAAMLSDSLTA